MPPKFSLLMAAIGELLAAWNEFREVSVVQFEREGLDLIVDVAPEGVLHAVPMVREQSELQAVVEIFPDHLRVVIGFEDDVPAIAEHRHLVVTFFAQFPDERALRGWDVRELVRGSGEFED